MRKNNIKIDYDDFKIAISNFVHNKGALIRLEIDNFNLKEIVEKIRSKCKFLKLQSKLEAAIKHLNEFNDINELRINIKYKIEGLFHCLGITKDYVNKDVLKNINVYAFIRTNNLQKIFVNRIFKNNKDSNIKTIAKKIKAFISYFKEIEDTFNDVKIFSVIEYVKYIGCYCFERNKNIMVVNTNTWNCSYDHIFCNCHIRSLRQENNINSYSNSKKIIYKNFAWENTRKQ